MSINQSVQRLKRIQAGLSAGSPFADELAQIIKELDGDGSLPKPQIRQTHTYVTLAVPKTFYDYVRGVLVEAGYEMIQSSEGERIPMQGIALEANPNAPVSVLQPWVMDLPLREQGTLLTGVRGCDLVPKLPLESTARQLTGFFRFCTLVPADPREIGIAGAFFQRIPPKFDFKASELGHLPLHWYSHVMHSYEVIGYRHPDKMLAKVGQDIYAKLAKSLHLPLESREQMIERLAEDRIASDTVVS